MKYGARNQIAAKVTEIKKGNQRAKLAIDIFIYRIRKYIGAYLTILGGCDAVVFTAGIGEHQANIRNKICSRLFTHLKTSPRILCRPRSDSSKTK